MRDLAAIQRAFYDLVTTGEGVMDPTPHSLIGSAANPGAAEGIDSGLLGGTRHLGVYADMYIDRLHDVLADDFPKLRTVLGHAVFRDLAVDFIRARPPTSFTVRDVGASLAEYLATRRAIDVPAWSANLAALERARADVFEGADAVALSRDALAAVPMDQFPELELRLIPASVIVPLQWTVDDLWSAVEDDAAHVMPEPCQRWVLVWRRDVRVLHRTLDDDEAPLVVLLARGATLAAVSARLAELGGDATEQRMVQLLTRWLDAELMTR